MNRENKKKVYEKNYYKTYPSNDTFVCKVCGKSDFVCGCVYGSIGRHRRIRRKTWLSLELTGK